MRPRKQCPFCDAWLSLDSYRRHTKVRCPRLHRRASKLRNHVGASLARLRRLGVDIQPPANPPPTNPPPALRDRLRSRSPTLPNINEELGSPDFEHPDFRFDTPGAGPGPSSREQSPRFAPYNPGEHGDGDVDDGLDRDEDNVLDALPWMHGLTVREYYAQNALYELMRDGGQQLPEHHRLTVQAFNYKVDTDISGRAYSKLPRAFPDHLDDLPMEPTLQKLIDKISAYGARVIDCCINSCVAYTAEYEPLESCPWCNEARYKPHPSNPTRRVARQTFRYLPLIPRLINLYRNLDVAQQLRYRSQRQPKPDALTDIFDGRHYRQLLQEFVFLGRERLGHRFFSRATDIALGLSTDGVGPFKTRTQQCWPLILINYNLPPSIRTRLENILCLGVIPGPHTPKELDTFLEPLIDELEELARGIPAFDAADRQPFVLHAYLIAAFGDMPAVAKLMHMKGPNGKLPCRACNIRGVRAPDGPHPNTNYVPLSRPFDNDPEGPPRYDPLNLPLRTNDQYLEQAMHVEEAINDAEEDRRSLQTGINGLSPLARVPGLSFPGSFPHDFMHLVFENIIPTLLDLWTRSGRFEKFGTGDEDHILHPNVWIEVAAACPVVCNLIPYAFGCRVPDLKTKRGEVTAEARLLFATLLGPILLRGRFRRDRYYKHFVRLVHFINLCLDFEIRPCDIKELREGFAQWVQDYERYYYANDPSRLSACTLPLHALLHVAEDIEAMGPVWAYWAFPMERFVGALTRICMSRRYPYSSMNRRVLQLSQLSQIKMVFGLTEELDLEERHENIRRGVRYDHYPDVLFVNPSKLALLQRSLLVKIAQYISRATGLDARAVRNKLATHRLKTWGRMQRLEKSFAGKELGGDVIRGAMLVSNSEKMRDASHVRYYSTCSRWYWDSVCPTEVDEEVPTYGRAEMFVVLEPELMQELGAPDVRPYVLAIISPFPRIRRISAADLLEYRLNSGGNYASAEVVDALKVDCLIGRVVTERHGTFIVERTSVVGRMDMLDMTVDLD